MYKFFIYIAMFLIYSFIGWVMEVIVTYPKYKKFVNRGFLIGPVVPIYGIGAMLITLFLTRYEKEPITLFLMAVIICSLLEYLTSYFMEKVFKTRWWDYSSKPFNINGRVCLSNMIAFGLLALFAIYVSNPFIINILEQINPFLLKAVVSILVIIFLTDLVLSTIIIYNIKGVGLALIKDSTDEINAKVKEALLSKGIFTRRVAHAFPNFKMNEKILERIQNKKDMYKKKKEEHNKKRNSR